jgi:hypothetical protein
MTSRNAVESGWFRRVAAVATALALLVPLAALPAAAQDTATFAGTVFEPSGAPVGAGFKVILTDVRSGAKYTAVTDAAGAYSIPVPLGGRYKLESAVAPDGTVLPVQNVPPIAALVPGTNRIDVKFSQAAPAPGAAAAAAAAPTPTPPPTAGTQVAQTTPTEEKKKKEGATPWYKKPGPIVGIVLGAVAVGVAVSSGGGTSKKGSASLPTD